MTGKSKKAMNLMVLLAAVLVVILHSPQVVRAEDALVVDLNAVDASQLTERNGYTYLDIIVPGRDVIFTGNNFEGIYNLNVQARSAVFYLSGDNYLESLSANCPTEFVSGDLVLKNSFTYPICIQNASLTVDAGAYITAAGLYDSIVIIGGQLVLNGGNVKAFSSAQSGIAMDEASVVFLNSGKLTLSGPTGSVRGGTVAAAPGTKQNGNWTDFNTFARTPDQKVVIVLDPGHGGSELGTTIAADYFPAGSYAYDHFLEKNLNWNVALGAYAALSQYSDAEVHLTREGDETVYNYSRTVRAAQYHPDLFLSLHMNSVADLAEINVATGAELWESVVPRYQRPELNSLLLSGVSSVGLMNRGIKQRPCIGTPDNGVITYYWDDTHNVYTQTPMMMYADYYTVLLGSAQQYFPAVILEHLHLSNIADMQYVITDEQAQYFGILDANSVATYYGLTK